MRTCKICNKEIIEEQKRGRIRIFCSKKCKDKSYYLNNIDKLKQRASEWHFAHKEQIKQRKKKHYYKNQKEYQARSRRWIKENPEKYKQSHKKARIKWIQTTQGKIVHKAQQRVYYKKLRLDYCQLCRIKEDLHFHHTNYEKDEGFTLCKECHTKIHKSQRAENNPNALSLLK